MSIIETDVKDNTENKEKNNTEITIIDESLLRDKIYEVRGVKVMLDFELAEIYGYTTKAFNQQVKRNRNKFPEDFMFRLNREEFKNLVRSQNVTSRNFMQGQEGGMRYLPWAFSESGIYMLMTILKGELATKQSIALIRTFRIMKDCIIVNQNMVGEREYLRLSMLVNDSIRDSIKMNKKLEDMGEDIKGILDKMSEVVLKSEIAPFLLELGKPEEKREYLLINGRPAMAAETYIDIYSRANKSVFIVDNYINVKTLRLLQDIKPEVRVIVFSDNIRHLLHAADYNDFHIEFPEIEVSFKINAGLMHDRFIVLDYDTDDEKVFHCGTSSKDAGVSNTTVITEFQDESVKKSFHSLMERLLNNPELELR